MTRILLIRHGEAAKKPGLEDPGLTELGRKQARILADQWAGHVRVRLISSPKLRARQTAEPLSRVWQAAVKLETAVNEIPSPLELPPEERGRWIKTLEPLAWSTLEPHQQVWRQNIWDYLCGIQEDTAIFCHFMVINSVVAGIKGADRIYQFRPDYTSVTELQSGPNGLTLRALGKEKDSHLL